MAGASKSGSFSGILSPSPTITTKKLMGSSNYISWSKAVELWCIGQGLQDHLTTKTENVTIDKIEWQRVDALLCSLLWQLIDPSLHLIYTNYTTCCELWAQAKALYTNDIQRLYSMVSNLLSLRQQGLTLPDFLDRMASIKAELTPCYLLIRLLQRI